jgi:elongation factor P
VAVSEAVVGDMAPYLLEDMAVRVLPSAISLAPPHIAPGTRVQVMTADGAYVEREKY